MELEKLMAPVEPNGLNAEIVVDVPQQGHASVDAEQNAVLQVAGNAGEIGGVNLASLSEEKQTDKEVENEEDEEEEEQMDGDNKDTFLKEENDEKDGSEGNEKWAPPLRRDIVLVRNRVYT